MHNNALQHFALSAAAFTELEEQFSFLAPCNTVKGAPVREQHGCVGVGHTKLLTPRNTSAAWRACNGQRDVCGIFIPFLPCQV
jgi:hypothetical protein